jgi:elongation factor 1-gamma
VNHADKAGEAMLETKKMFQSEGFADGYSWWHMRYDKYGSEGQVMYKFANLLGGFLQRIDTKLGRYAFGRVIMLGEEPNLDIECVFMFRGQEIPEIMREHVSYEYFTNKKLDFMGNEDDYNMICQFMSA